MSLNVSWYSEKFGIGHLGDRALRRMGGCCSKWVFHLFFIFIKPKFYHCLPLSVNHYYLTNSCCRDLIDLFSSIDLDVYYLALKVRGLSARTPCQGWGWGYTSVDQQVEILQMRKYHRYKYHKHWNILDTEILNILLAQNSAAKNPKE